MATTNPTNMPKTNIPIPPIYDDTATTTIGTIINMITFIYKYVVYYISNNRIETIFILGLIVYTILISILFLKNPYDIINADNGGISIIMALLGGFLIVIMFIFYTQKKQSVGNEPINGISFIGKTLSIFLYLALFVGLFYGTFILATKYTHITSLLLFMINAFIVFGFLALIFKYFNIRGSEPGELSKPSWLRLIFKIISYIPCQILEIIDYIKYQYQITTRPIIILLFVEIFLIASYFLLPRIMDIIMTHNASQLLKYPTNINMVTNLGSFKDINYIDDRFNYHYAVSSWFYINSFPPETNPNYDEYVSLLNIGDKPNIMFNVMKNTLKIKLTTQGHNETILFETTDFKLQRWNHIVINYDGSTLDIFLNNTLVSTTPGVIPYNANTMITSGTENGILGGISNVMYFKDSISRNKISWLYNSSNN